MNLRANVAVAVVARRPQVEGPVTLDRFTCPASRFDIVAPRFDAKASFNESFTSVDGSGRMAISTLTAGANGLAAFAGDLTYKGPLDDVSRPGEACPRSSRGWRPSTPTARGSTAAITSASAAGTFAHGRRLRRGQRDARPVDARGRDAAARGRGQDPDRAGRDQHRQCDQPHRAQLQRRPGTIRVVNFPGGGAARINSADIIGPSGARARVSGGSGVTYYWPSGGLRIDGNIQMAGGGLPQRPRDAFASRAPERR